MYSLLLALIYLIFVSLGLPDSLLGAGWPTMRIAFDMPLSAAGIISMIISCGTICSSILSERMTKKTNTQFVTITSIALTAVALLGFSFSTKFWMLCAWAVPYGLGAGAIDSAMNNYVALHYSARHMSWLHCFWGVGTIISPYIMSLAITDSSWNNGYRTVAFIQTGIIIILLCTLRVWKINSKKANEVKNSKILGIRGVVKIKGATCLFGGFFAYCAAESTASLWASSYLVGTRGVSEETAAAFASLFFIGITVGRLISGFISEKLGDRKMIRLGTAIAVMGIAMIALPLKTDVFALSGLIVFGLGCAPIYPSIIHCTPENFGAENSQAIIGLQMASAYLGTTLMPPLFGVIAGNTTLKLFPLYLILFTALMIFMIEKTYKIIAKEKGRENEKHA